MESGCLGYPGAYTVSSQLVDRIQFPGLANPRNPAMSPHYRNLSAPIRSVEWRIKKKTKQCLKTTAPNHSGLLKHLFQNCTEKPTLRSNVPCEPALARSTTGQTCTKLVVANFVIFDIFKTKSITI